MSEINPIDHKSIKARHFPRDNTRFLCEKRVYFNFNDWSWNIPFSHTKFFPLLTQKFLTFRTSRIFQSPCGHIGFMISVGIWCWGAGNFAMFCCNQELVKAFANIMARCMFHYGLKILIQCPLQSELADELGQKGSQHMCLAWLVTEVLAASQGPVFLCHFPAGSSGYSPSCKLPVIISPNWHLWRNFWHGGAAAVAFHH